MSSSKAGDERMKGQRLWLGFALLFLIWLTMHVFVDGRIIPSPFATMVTLGQLLISGELLMHMVYSLYRLTSAIGVALLLGAFSGVMMGMHKKIEALFAPFIYIMFPVPKAALLPIIFVLFGLGDLSKIVLIYLILYFQITLAVYDAVIGLSEDVFLSARTLQLTGFQLYKHVVLPAILPNILTALRVSVGIGIAVLFFAETYATSQGLGYFIMNHWSLLNYEAMYSGIILLGALGYVIFRVIDTLRDRLVKWM